MPAPPKHAPRSPEQEAADQRLVDAVRRVRGGDQSAFRVLVERYQRPLYVVLMRYVSQPDDALDLAQRAFVRAYQQIDTLEKPEAFGAWLFRIGINLALNQRRSAAQRATTPLESVAEPHIDPAAEDQLVLQQRVDAVREALPQLSPMQRDVLLMRFDGDLSYRDIAEAVGSTEGAVRVHFHNAVKRLRELLTPRESSQPNLQRVTP